MQLLDVSDGSTMTAWRLEGKQVAIEVPNLLDETTLNLVLYPGMLLESRTVACTRGCSRLCGLPDR